VVSVPHEKDELHRGRADSKTARSSRKRGRVISRLMIMWPISTRVNKPENDDPAIVEPIELSAA
jgi:hypothetical protein